jgi:hypothetical protein
MKTKLLLLTAVLALTGCAGQQIGISIPVPPSGADMGKYGFVKLGYEPNALTTPYLNGWTNYVTVTTNQYK